jgi:D-beta-D-heptose 7-phosphate kinase/D-beta-D-heptose 1-phosphate adenosyltransferase
MKKYGITSMYANPIHPGHIECLELSKQLVDELWVIVNNDKQAEIKRGVPSFQNQEDRKKIVESIKYVDRAEISVDIDASVCQSIVKLYVDIKQIDPDCEIIFTKGGDRFAGEIPEKALCDSLGIRIVDGLGEKTHNSSEMVKTNK